MYSAKLTPKSRLGQLVSSWLGRKFDQDEKYDVSELAGKACQLTLIHEADKKGVTREVIKGITGVPKGIKVRKPETPVETCFLTKQEWNQGFFDELPEWLQNIIKKSPEYKVVAGGKAAPVKGKELPAKPAAAKGKGGKGKDDVPF